MQKKLLIDASHLEETRIVLLNQQQVEEFDFESINKKQIAGNIFLAKVTRVEPSLQAAFLDYGGNRHGFLAFSEIHPDYYQIPIADKKLLLENTFPSDEHPEESVEIDFLYNKFEKQTTDENNFFSIRDISYAEKVNIEETSKDLNQKLNVSSNVNQKIKLLKDEILENSFQSSLDYNEHSIKTQTVEMYDELVKENLLEKPKKRQIKTKYKIQEVIKVRQVLLIQVVKDERGNKGAALTTYISLAGRYCVLMPNTAKGGGISRKITNIGDRKKLKETANEFAIPDKMGLIIRTAGAKKTKSEIKKDYEYLLRQWEQIRTLTLKSIAPCPIYEEGSVIKRTIRDLYSKEINEILVEGEIGFNEARDYMRMLMPTHTKKIKKYTNNRPIFSFYGIEDYLSGMFNPNVQLKSGGYIVIGVTEALVAIDVNSGKATKESGIEETALRTNLEAADEIARQLRMRDLAGLIVIDFIDMDDRKNNVAVEKRIRDSLKIDRARIQVGKISTFGLLEMSRQRLRYGMIEATTKLCGNCYGTGLTRSNENLSLSILRKLETIELENNTKEINVKAPIDVANYILNHKRRYLKEIEKTLNTNIFIISDLTINNPNYIIEFNKNSNNYEEDASLSNVITMDGSNISNTDDNVSKTLPKDNNSNNTETINDTKFKNPKRRRRKNSKFRKFDPKNGEKHLNNNFEVSNEIQKNKKFEDVENLGIENVIDIKNNTINPDNKDLNKKSGINNPKISKKTNNVKQKKYQPELSKKNTTSTVELTHKDQNLPHPNIDESKMKSAKPVRKRVVKKVKEVLDKKSKIDNKKIPEGDNKKAKSDTSIPKSGWWVKKN